MNKGGNTGSYLYHTISSTDVDKTRIRKLKDKVVEFMENYLPGTSIVEKTSVDYQNYLVFEVGQAPLSEKNISLLKSIFHGITVDTDKRILMIPKNISVADVDKNTVAYYKKTEKPTKPLWQFVSVTTIAAIITVSLTLKLHDIVVF